MRGSGDGPGLGGGTAADSSTAPERAQPRSPPEDAGDVALHEPHVPPRLARRVRLASPDRHQHPVAGEAAAAMSPQERKGDHLAAPHPRHEQQPRDHRIDPAALQGDVVDRGRQRSAGSRPKHPGGSLPRPGSARRRDGPGSAPQPPPSTRSTRLSPAREARGSRRASRPRGAAAEDPGIRPPGVRADGGLHEPPSGRRRTLTTAGVRVGGPA